MDEQQSSEDIQYIGQFHVEEYLGQGTNGAVYKCKSPDKTLYTIKIFTAQLIQQNMLQNMEKECQSLIDVKSPFVQQYQKIFFNKEKLPCIVLDYCNEPNLQKKIFSAPNQYITEDEAIQIVVQILKGIKAIHDKEIIHCNLKCENILFHDGKVKIADFGIAMKFLSKNSICKTINESPSYEAPELLQNQNISYKVDIWSIGVILYFMLLGKLPFGRQKNAEKQLNVIKEVCHPEFDFIKALTQPPLMLETQEVSKSMKDLLGIMLQINPEKRASYVDLMKHDLLKQYFNQNDTQQIHTSFNKLQRLQTFQQKKFNGEEQDNESEEQKDISPLSKLTKINSKWMVAKKNLVFCSMLLGKKNELNAAPEDSDYDGILKKYNKALAIYTLLIDNYKQFESDMHLEVCCEREEFILLKFFLVKLIVYFQYFLMEKLQAKFDLFGDFSQNQQDLKKFQASKLYNQLTDKVVQDYEEWIVIFKERLQEAQCLDMKFKSKDIEQGINDLISFPDHTDYNKIPDQLKLPCRAIIMTCFKKIYHDCLNSKKLVELKEKESKTGWGKNLRKANLQPLDKSFSQCLRLLICSCVNRIIPINSDQIRLSEFQSDPKASYKLADLLGWIHKIDTDSSNKQIEILLKLYFPQLIGIDYNFIQ